MLTQKQVKDLLWYDPETGIFRWRVGLQKGRIQPWDVAGSVSKHLGYRVINFFKRPWLEHRLAALYMTGQWPEHQIDHLNGIRADNRWCNLRDVCDRVNKENRRKPLANNLLGVLGVSYWASRPGSKKFVAQLVVRGVRVLCSYHTTAEKAHAAYLAAKRTLHEGNTL